jgi:hypothetical protein
MVRIQSDEQKRRRAETSRRNGALSRGPRTDQTKFISSKNSIKHACYAVVHTLPDEPVDFAIGLRERWFADKKPETPEEEMLVEEMFRGDLMSKRYHRSMDRALLNQYEKMIDHCEEANEETAGTLMKGLATTPADNVENVLDVVLSFGAGVRLVIREFEELGAALGSPGYWDCGLCRRAIRQLGVAPGAAAQGERSDVYQLVLCNFLSMPEVLRPHEEVERMLRPENRPLELRNVLRTELLVPAAEARAALEEWVQEKLAELKQTLDDVVREVDGPSRAKKIELGAALLDPDQVKRFKQIGSEYRSLYYRASGTFRGLRKDKAAENRAPKKADQADARGSDENAASAGPPAAATAPVATPSPAPPQATEMDITPSVCESTDGAENTRSCETEVVIEKQVAEQDPGAGPDSGNEPSSGVAAAPERPLATIAAAPVVAPSCAQEPAAEGAAPAAAHACEDGARTPTRLTWEPSPDNWLMDGNPPVARRPGDESAARTREDAAPGSAANVTWTGEAWPTGGQVPGARPPAHGRGPDGPNWPIDLHSPGYAVIQQRAESLAAYRRQRAEEQARRPRDG